MKILVTPTSFTASLKSPAHNLLKSFSDEIIYNPYGRPIQPEELIELLDGVDGCIAGLDYYTKEVLSSAKNLKVLSRYGAGFDRVDLSTASKQDIVVTNTPGVNAQAVADLTLALILSVARKIPLADQNTKAGRWESLRGFEIYGKKIGILGLGNIGKNVSKRAQGFSMDVLAYDPYIDHKYTKENNIVEASLSQIIKECDVISLHLPLNENTRHIINGQSFDNMKKGVIVVNTSRGGLIDENAAYTALESGKLGGLALDVFEKEPPEQSKLFGFNNVVLTPHIGARTFEATQNMTIASVQNLINVLSGNECDFIVNKK